MKKKIVTFAMLTVACLAFTACSKKEDAVVSEVPAATETEVIETEAAETENAETVVDEAEVVASEENQNNADLTAMAPEEITAFADAIKKCVADKDIEGLAELTAYPTYVALGEGMVVETKEDFIAIGADELFTEELVNAIKDYPTDALETSMAGVTLGESKPNITFNMVEGKLGIQGINY